MARRKLRVVRDLPTTPRKPRTPDRDRYLSECSRSVFKKGTWLTIGQLSRAFASAHRVRTLGLPVTVTDLDVLRFIFTFGAPEGGRHRWRVYGTPTTLVRSLSKRTYLAAPHVRKSLRRLQELELLDILGEEVWTTQQMHLIGAEILWSDQLWQACPSEPKLDWYTVTRDADRLFRAGKLDPTKPADRRDVMRTVAEEVQRRCTSG